MTGHTIKGLSKALAALVLIALVVGYMPIHSADATESTIVYHETFADGKGKVVQSGGAALAQVKGKTFDGNADGAALYVNNRVNNWDAADFKFSDIGLKEGKTYNIKVTGYVDADVKVPTGAGAALQTDKTYAWLKGVDFKAGKNFVLEAEYTVSSSDTALRVQSNEEGKTTPFYIGDILITEKASATVDNSKKPDEKSEAGKSIYHETFADGQGKAVQSGGANLAQVKGKTFEGNDDGAALYVSNRVNNWDAADIRFSDAGMKEGKTYSIKVVGYVDAEVKVPAGAVAALQTDKTYAWLKGVDYKAGKNFILEAEYTVSSSDTALRIQSNEEGKAVPFYIGDILITEKGAVAAADDSRPAAEKMAVIDFEDKTTGGFEGRAGTETLAVTDKENHSNSGKYSLKVEGRTASWNGPSLRIEKYIEKGSEYAITAWVKLISPASANIQLSSQIGNGESANYANVSNKTVNTADGWVKFEGTYRYNSVGDEYLTIYIESSDAAAAFYIDDISLVSTSAGPVEIEKELSGIKDVYKNEFLIGNCISAEDLEGVRFDLLNKHFNSVTAGNGMKPDALQREKGKFTFDAADKLIGKFIDNGFKVHGHVLVWHSQSPVWLNTTKDSKGNVVPLGREEALTNLRTHIKTVMEHFGDKVISWDVVNEAMNDSPANPSDWQGSLRQAPWYNAIGPDYVEQAFLAAREVLDAHPQWNIRLYYNDYNLDNQSKSKAVYNMVKELNEKYAKTHPGKLLIDGVGMQGHYSMSTNPVNVELSLERFISLGVKVSISELDIQAGSNFVMTEDVSKAQGYLYAQLFKIFNAHASDIERVTFWGTDDGTSWRSSTNPTPFDKNLKAKPAYYGLIDPDEYMSSNPPKAPKVAKKSAAKFGTPVIDGKAEDIWKDTPELPINQYQMAWNGATGTAKALWDNKNLYVLLQVNDVQLDKGSANAWEQDSVEAFVDENNGKTTFYEDDDGQYRVNFENTASFNPAAIAEGFESAVKVSGTSYTVEMKIAFKAITPEYGKEIGFDAQINDGKDGARQSAATWNDLTGNGYQDTSVYGTLTLTRFGNVEPSDYFYDAVEYFSGNGIITGTAYDPKHILTCGEAVEMILKAYGVKPLADGYYAKAKELGITNGIDISVIGADKLITREALFTLAYNTDLVIKKSELDADKSALSAFKDNEELSDWSVKAISRLVKDGIVKGKDKSMLMPGVEASSGEVVTILYRLLSR